jgi:hypothetical protein
MPKLTILNRKREGEIMLVVLLVLRTRTTY